MSESNRPPGFRMPPAVPVEMHLYFFEAEGDYVIAATPSAASCFWMDHFNDLCYAKDFVQLPDDEFVEICVDHDTCKVLDLETVKEWRRIYPSEGYVSGMPAAYWAKEYGPGYLASTKED